MQTITRTLRTVAAIAMIQAAFVLASGWMSVALAAAGGPAEAPPNATRAVLPVQPVRRAIRTRSPLQLRSACLPLHRRQRVIPAADLLDDGVRIGGPDERPRVPVVLVDETIDLLPQGDQRGKLSRLSRRRVGLAKKV